MKNYFKILLVLTICLVGSFAFGLFDGLASGQYSDPIVFIKDFVIGGGIASYAAVPPWANLEKTAGECNLAGIKTYVYVIAVADLASFAVLVSDPATLEEEVTLVGNNVPKAGQYFIRLYSTRELGSWGFEQDGPRDGEFFNHNGTAMYPGLTKKALGLATQFKGTDVIVIIQEKSGGKYFQIGTEDLPARITSNGTTGLALTDQKGITYEITAENCNAGLIYEGTIPLEGESS